MKFVTLRTERPHPREKLHKSSKAEETTLSQNQRPPLRKAGCWLCYCNASATQSSNWPGVAHTASICAPCFGISSPGRGTRSWRPRWSTSRVALESLPMYHQIHTYTELREQIHNDLRIQHPEWIQPNGESPTCDAYESRLVEMLDTLTRRGSNGSIVPPHHALEQAVTGR